MILPLDRAIEIVGWKARKLEGLPLMAAKMMLILQTLVDSKEAGYPFVHLEGIHKRTLNSLTNRDWIVASKGVDGDICYKITGRGTKALKVYQCDLKRRYDGICPRCNDRPKHIQANGKVAPYCTECDRQLGREKYHRGVGKVPGRICPKCNDRPRHVRESGRSASYCQPCRRKASKKQRKRRQQRLRKRINAGEVVVCWKCKTNPVYYTENSVYDYCYDCWTEYQADYRRRKIWRRVMES